MKRLELINIVEEVGTNNANLQAILKAEVKKKLTNNKLFDDISDVELSEKIRLFVQKFRIKYAEHSRNFERLIKQEEPWLECDLFYNKDTNPESILKEGRPEKKWAEYSLRTKRRKVSSLAKVHTTEELSEAAILRAKSSPGKSSLGKKIKLLSENKNETNQIDKHQPIMMSADQALSLKIHCDLSDLQYQMIRNSSLVQNANIYPPLKTILKSKADCYPEGLFITETSASCSLQDMVNHTLSRILKLSSELLQNLDETVTHGVFNLKCGMDGSSLQSIYNQRFDDTDLTTGVQNEQSMFQTAIVPLKLRIGDSNIWYNPAPSSPNFCRSLQLKYQKETSELIAQEEVRLRKQIENLQDYILNLDLSNEKRCLIEIKIVVDLTMLDGKSVNAIMLLNSSQSCNVCFAKPSEMNNLLKIRTFIPDEKSLAMGISTLHCWIRLFEYVLHLGYKMKIKKYQARSKEHKLSVIEQKSEIQNRFRSELSLVVDMPKHGYGSSNTGNTARRAFENADTFADITGVDVKIIIRLRNIMKAVCSGYHLDLETFKKYCLDTSEIIVEKYNWYIMPPTVHKLLEHGFQISECFELPVGIYSEEAQEAQNKYIRNARLDHTCKISRKNAMENQYHYLLLRSDPIVSSFSFKMKKSIGTVNLDTEVLKLLLVEQ